MIPLVLVLAACSAADDAGFEPDARVPACGDGILDPGEECDDGPENTDWVVGACRTDCRIQVCGNGVIDASELCDDGNLNDDDSCPADCGESLPGCGNGVLDSGEQCDDGNEDNWDGCTLVCQQAERRVNTARQGDQQGPTVGIAADGRFAVVWTDVTGSPETQNVKVRLFAPSGNPTTGEIQVSQTPLIYGDIVVVPNIYMSDEGSFSIIWQAHRDQDMWSALLKRDFTADGSPLGDEHAVDSCTDCPDLNPLFPEVTGTGDGRHLVVWQATSVHHRTTSGIYAQRYRADGTRDGSEILVSEILTNHSIINASMNNTGEFIVAWVGEEYQEPFFVSALWGRRFGPDDSPTGPEARFAREDDVQLYLIYPNVGLADDGRFVLMWTEKGLESGHFYRCYYQLYNQHGAPLSDATDCFLPEIQHTIGEAAYMLPDGRFVLLWNFNGEDPESIEPGGQQRNQYLGLFDRDSVLVKPPMPVTLYPLWRFGGNGLAVNASGRITVAFILAFCDQSLIGYPPDAGCDEDVYVRVFPDQW